MAFVGKLNMGSISNFFSSVQNIYNELNPATLSGAVDIVVVEQQDGELACSPFHVRFGKFSLLMPQEKKVVITVNDQTVPYVMKLGEAGEAFFVFETEHEVPEEFQTSPLLEAVDETKTGEEPPYLDIGESKNQSTAATATPSKESKGKKDEFDDDDEEEGKDKKDKLPNVDTTSPNNSTNDINKLSIPAELQSPKMIIEEQMDKVVTKVDPYQKHHLQQLENKVDKLTLQESDKKDEKTAKHDTYPLDDGSMLLERVQPAEAVTSTTIAKETFIVRPANGDINSKWMDVTHTSVYNKLTGMKDNVSSDKRPQKKQNEQKQPIPQKNAEHESIVLDIAGYKTENEHRHHHHQHQHQHDKENRVLGGYHDDDNDIQQQDDFIDSPRPLDSSHHGEKNENSKKEEEGDDKESKKEVIENVTPTATTTGWGWGNNRRKSSTPSSSSTTNANATTMAQTRTSRSSSTSMVGTKKLQLEPGIVYRIELSLCGLTTFGTKEEENAILFNEHQITYDTFVHNPNLLNDQRLVFRYEGLYYAAGRSGPLFTSLLLFHEPPPMNKISEGGHQHNGSGSESGRLNKVNHHHHDQDSDSRESYLFGRGWRQWWSRSSVTRPTSTVDNNNPPGDANGITTVNEDGKEKSEKTTTRLTTTTTTTSVGWSPDHHHEHHPLDQQQQQELEQQEPTTATPSIPHKNYAKTLRLTSDQLKCLGLKKGPNTVSFSVTTEYQGTATCMAQIFYWDHDIQIVISDIDGTITKSDALGHVFNFIGKDWTHTGVAKLYTDITNNGYHILYLTSRAIGQADYTRDYLKRVEQDGKYQLPQGPVIMSPDRLFTSFHREVIMRKPEVFKMACLRDIQRLFGDSSKPFYAGFGNRITDAISYRSVHVPASRIFTIDPNGDVKLELLLGFLSSYIHLNDLVDQIFPPINKNIGEEFNDWNYWKQPLPEIDISDLPLITKAAVSNGTAPSGDSGEGDATVSNGGSSKSILPPVSPKPIPIKPDPTGALPSETIIESEAQKQRQQRGNLLRSFTTRSSSTTTNSTSESNTLSSRLSARHFSTSTPSLVITSRSGRTSPADSVRSGSPPSPSSPENEKYHHIPHFSSSDDLLSAPNNASPAPSSTSSTSSLMNKMTTGFGGVLSRTFAPRKSSLSEELLDHPATLSRTGSKGEGGDDQQPTFDIDDDEDEELDLDSIPFI